MTMLTLVRKATERTQTTLSDRAKRALKLAVSACLYAADTAVSAAVPNHQRGRRSAGVVLMYHDVALHHRDRFAHQCDELLRLARPTTLADLGTPDRHDSGWRVAVTFDDGFRSFSQVAMPELERRSIPSTMFVSTEWTLESVPFASDPSAIVKPDGSPIHLTPADIAQLPHTVEVGSHSRTHVRLPTLSDDELKQELAGSREELAAMASRPIRFHAYPHGERDDRVDTAAAAAGYERCYGIVPAEVRQDGSFVVGRVQVDPTDWTVEFRLKVLGAYRWMGWWMTAKQRVRSRASSGAIS